MATAKVNLDGKELCINLDGMTEEEAREAFLHLGRSIQGLSDRRLACLGNSIVEALTGQDQTGACLFCAIDRRLGRPPCGQRGVSGDEAKQEDPTPAGRRRGVR